MVIGKTHSLRSLSRLLFIFLLSLVSALGGLPSHASALPAGPMLSARSAFLLDDSTGRALYAYHADILRYPASTAKMMTALVALQRLKLGAILTVPPGAVTTPDETSAGLAAGERMTVRNLLYGLLLPSGNDAAITLAVAISGSTLSFSNLMNAQARRLHLWHTHFLGATGLDSAGQYSTARDLAWLGHAVLRQPLLRSIVATRTYRAASVDGRFVHSWTNLNRLLSSYAGSVGIKTGTTPLAGANLVGAATRRNRRIIAVIMGSTVNTRYSDATKLLDYGWRLLPG